MSLTIEPVLCLKNFMDNYAYILTDTESKISAVIDAAEAEPIIARCEQQKIRPSYIFTTHHHPDHRGGNRLLKEKYGLQIVVPDAEKDLFDEVDRTLQDGETFRLGQTELTAVSAPGHTIGHLLYYARKENVLFTGDVLFNLSIGNVEAGRTRQMWDSLQAIKQLPDDVLFYPGHEYTAYGLQTLLHHADTQPAELYLRLAQPRLEKGLPVAPIRLGLEKQCNPYLGLDNFKTFERLF